MQEIKDADAGKCLGDDVRENRGGGGCIHVWLAEGDVVELGDGVDEYEDIARLKS